jgi:hypothetical protein
VQGPWGHTQGFCYQRAGSTCCQGDCLPTSAVHSCAQKEAWEPPRGTWSTASVSRKHEVGDLEGGNLKVSLACVGHGFFQGSCLRKALGHCLMSTEDRAGACWLGHGLGFVLVECLTSLPACIGRPVAGGVPACLRGGEL